jgi:hypothetical protein
MVGDDIGVVCGSEGREFGSTSGLSYARAGIPLEVVEEENIRSSRVIFPHILPTNAAEVTK